MKLPSYPRTKPSGVEWLGDVPEHWSVKRLKYSASINDEALPETTSPDFEFEYVDIGGVNAVEGITTTEQLVFENAPSRARRKVRHGDTVVSTVRTYLRAIAPIKEPPQNLIVSTGFAVVRPRKVDSAFLAYALRESSFVESVVARSTGVSYPAVNASEVGGIPIPLPTPAEQRAIAAFLDWETGRLDRLVAKKRELIERLKEKRTALISRTVTRGLPPAAARATGIYPQMAPISADEKQPVPKNLCPSASSADPLSESPPLKPSGLDWLGNIPKHWEVKRLKFTVKERLQYGANESSEIDDPDLPRYVRITDIDEMGKLRPETFRSLPVEIAREYFLEDGDVLFARSGATSGKTFLYRSEWGTCAYAGYLIRARLDQRKIEPQFLRHFTDSSHYWQWLSSSLIQATIQNVSAEKYADLALPLPPLPEQAAIAAYLDLETAKLDALVGKVEAAVERLQEYRTALITAAVTGKIDVRPTKRVASTSP